MIKSFADRRTQAPLKAEQFPPDIANRASRKLEYLDLAVRLDDLKVPRSNRLHALSGDRKGQHETGLAIFVLVGFVLPVPLLAWLDRRSRNGK